jgi:hypothetical protein
MKRIVLILLLLLTIPWAHGGTTGTPSNRIIEWIEEPIDELEYIVLGTAHPAEAGVHGVTIVASTKYVTSILSIPLGTMYADITIRSGSESATILSASQVAGSIDSASFVSGATLAFFTRYHDAKMFASDIQNDAYNGNSLLYAGDTISNVSQISGTDSSEYDFYAINRSSNSASNFLKSYGVYRIPVGGGYLVMKFDSPPAVWALNRIGQFISIRFCRMR